MQATPLQITAVIPVKDRAALLARCLDSLTTSAAQYGAANIVVCDNDSTDDSVGVASAFGAPVTVVQSHANRVGGVRNDGVAASPQADVFAFVDCDCVVPRNFFAAIADVLGESGAAAVGCEVLSPNDGHWSERVWEPGKGMQWSVTTAATLLHLASSIAGFAAGITLLFRGQGPLAGAVAALGLLAFPTMFVVARAAKHRRMVPIVGGIALMSITFLARLHGLWSTDREGRVLERNTLMIGASIHRA